MTRSIRTAALTLALTALAWPAMAQDADRKVDGGGIAVDGWQGRIDAAAAAKGMTLEHSKFAASGDELHLTIGPAAIYWKDGDTASGNYTVSATFKEAKPDTGHPHPYGLFIGGRDLDTDTPTFLYCTAYSNGSYLVRGFAAGKVITVARRAPHDAVAQPGADDSVAQAIAWTVDNGTATCSINGQAVGSFDAATLAGQGFASTDGAYGLRVSHNLDVVVSNYGKK